MSVDGRAELIFVKRRCGERSHRQSERKGVSAHEVPPIRWLPSAELARGVIVAPGPGPDAESRKFNLGIVLEPKL